MGRKKIFKNKQAADMANYWRKKNGWDNKELKIHHPELFLEESKSEGDKFDFFKKDPKNKWDFFEEESKIEEEIEPKPQIFDGCPFRFVSPLYPHENSFRN